MSGKSQSETKAKPAELDEAQLDEAQGGATGEQALVTVYTSVGVIETETVGAAKSPSVGDTTLRTRFSKDQAFP